MLTWTVWVLFIVGLIAVIKGADWVVDSAVWLSKSFGIPEVIVGATIVSIGTTLPETMISSLGALRGSSDVVIGTALGSIIFNTGMILGLGALIKPVLIKDKDSFFKICSMIGVLILFDLLAADGVVGGIDSVILIGLLMAYLGVNVWASSNSDNKNQKQTYTKQQLISKIVQFFIGVAAVIIGARVLLDSGEIIARAFGISEAIIAVTMYAIGSSFPELVTSLTAAVKGHNDLLLGNIVGANTLNIILVFGVSSIIHPLSVNLGNLYTQIAMALLLMVILVVPAFFTKKITRIQGVTAAVAYLVFIVTFVIR